jgi:redox-sensitive bicupin YhaK (pirin superfamily)
VKPALEWEVEKLHEHQDHDGAPGEGAGEARIIAGRLSDTSGPAHTFTPVNVWDVRLNGGAEARLPLPEGHTAMIVVLSGRVSADDDQVPSAAQMLLLD